MNTDMVSTVGKTSSMSRIRTWFAKRRLRKECKRNGSHLGPVWIRTDGEWLNEGEPIFWKLFHCRHCETCFVRWLDNLGRLTGPEVASRGGSRSTDAPLAIWPPDDGDKAMNTVGKTS